MSSEDDPAERARETLSKAVGELLDADPRPDAAIARDAWPGPKATTARRHLTLLRQGELWLGAGKAQQLADALGVEIAALYGRPKRRRKHE